jgi:hypothetical protein
VSDSYGIAMEKSLRELAARVGVADFVFKPVDRRKGAAMREIGDFLLWVGRSVAVVSVKTRHPHSRVAETDFRKRRWLETNIEDARGQIGGVVRNLCNLRPGELVLESERGVRVTWDPAIVAGFVGVVIVDADTPSDVFTPPAMNDPVPTIAVLARDWDFLHQVLPSTTGIINYVAARHRQFPAVPLGAEPDVFALMAENEGSGEPIVIPDKGLPHGYWREVREREPKLFFGSLPAHRFARIIDTMIEGAVDSDPEFSDMASPTDYMHIVEFLDRIPMLHRIQVGESILQVCEQVSKSGGYKSRLMGFPHGLMVFVSDSGPRQARAEFLRDLTFARHSQALDAGARKSLVTAGVATEPLPTPRRSHDFIFVSGGIRSDREWRAHVDERFGTPDLAEFVEMWEVSLSPEGQTG